jgi:hypothetical protein
MKLRRTPLLPLLSLAPLRDLVAVMAPLQAPVAVLRLLRRRATCKRPSPPLRTTSTARIIVSGFQHCMSLHGDTTEEFTKYMARLNESLAQLSTVQPMSLSEIYALGALIGLHQSGSSRHERAYRELLTYINEGNALTLAEVLKTGLRYSRDHHHAAQAFRAVHDDATVCNHACPLCCKPRPLALRARAPLLDRLRLAAPAALSPVVRYLLLLPLKPAATRRFIPLQIMSVPQP